jgi:D-xylose transport system ATP-binding protein
MVDVMEVADRVIVLRLGRRVATFDTATTSGDVIIAAITGSDQKR